MQDEIIDATQVRRLKKVEWTDLDRDQIIKKPLPGRTKNEIWHSETEEKNEIFKVIDKRGYVGPKECGDENVVYREVDAWIDICRAAATLGGRTARELAIENGELRLDFETSRAELEPLVGRLKETVDHLRNGWRNQAVELSVARDQLSDALDQLQLKEQELELKEAEFNQQNQELVAIRKGMRTLERKLRRERYEFEAYRALVQTAEEAASVTAEASRSLGGSSQIAGRDHRDGRGGRGGQGGRGGRGRAGAYRLRGRGRGGH